MNYFTSLILLFYFSCSAYGQSLDALYRDYYSLDRQDIVGRKLLLRKIIDKELYRNPKRSLEQVDTLVGFHKQLNDKDSVQESQYRLKGVIYAQLSDTRSAIQHYKRYFEYQKNKQGDGEQGFSDPYLYLDWGNAYFHSGLYKSARGYYQEAERLFRETSNHQGLSTIYGNYALIAFEQDRPKQGIELLRQVLSIQEQQVRDSLQMAHAHVVLAEYYMAKLQNYAKAKLHALRCLNLLLAPEMKRRSAFEQFIPNAAKAYNYLAQVYFHQNKLDSSFYYIDKGQALVERYSIPKLHYVLNNSLTDILIRLQRYPAARLINQKNLADSLPPVPENSIRFQYAATIAQALGNERAAQSYQARYYKERFQHVERQYNEDMLLAGNLLEDERKDYRLQKQSSDLQQERQLRYALLLIISIVVLALLGISFLWLRLRRRRQELQQVSEELQAANTTKDLMLAVLGHDLRAPFQVIWNSTGQLQNAIEHGRLSKVGQLSKELNRASRRAYSLLDGLMQWVGSQENHQAVQKEALSLQQVVERSVQSLSSLLEVQKLQIKYDMDDWELHSDPNLLQIILRNLLSNAIRYSPFRGTIYLSTVQSGTEHYLEVADEGEGVPNFLLGKLQLDENPVEVLKKGGGLGLALVQRVSEQLGLHISVHLREGRGSAFRLYFPQARNLPAASSLASTAALKKEQTLSLTARRRLIPLVQALAPYEIFESTALLRLLQNQAPPKEPSEKAWLEAVWQAVQNMDEHRFQQLLHQALNQEYEP